MSCQNLVLNLIVSLKYITIQRRKEWRNNTQTVQPLNQPPEFVDLTKLDQAVYCAQNKKK